MAIAYIGLGSNLGDREANLRNAAIADRGTSPGRGSEEKLHLGNQTRWTTWTSPSF